MRAFTAVGDVRVPTRWLVTHPEEMDAVSRRADPERLTGSPDNPVNALNAFVTDRLDSGDLIAAPAPAVIGVLQVVMLLPVNARRLAAPDSYAQTLDLLVDIVARGLAARKE